MTEAEKGYNGWKNYETWNVALWLGNEEGSHEEALCMAADVYRDAVPGKYEWQTRESQAAYELGKQFQAMIEDANPLVGDASMFSDLLSAALSAVEWSDIARHYLDDVMPGIDAEMGDDLGEVDYQGDGDGSEVA